MLPVLIAVFVVLPIVELYVIVQVAHVIHVLPTIGLLLLVSVVGAAVVKREGAKAWQAFTTAIGEGRVPAKETADGALILLGGALLVTPGFVTDILGALLVLKPTRALVRLAITRAAARRTGMRTVRVRSVRTTTDTSPQPDPREGPDSTRSAT